MTSLKIMEVMLESKAKLSELCKEVRIYPQKLVNVRVKNKSDVREDTEITDYVSKLGEELGRDGRILVRESGTEPVIRVMAEAITDELCEDIVNKIVTKLEEQGHVVHE